MHMQMFGSLWMSTILLVSFGASALRAQAKSSSDFLYLWTASFDTTQMDFLAVFDVRPTPDRYGRLVATTRRGVQPGPGRRESLMPRPLFNRSRRTS